MNFLVSLANIAAFTLKSVIRRVFGLKTQVVTIKDNLD